MARAQTDGAKAIQTGGSIIHEVGGAIMGADRARSVTNQWGQTWDVKNVFVTDGAVFPSNADKNPTLTIMALAWRACGSHPRSHAPQGACDGPPHDDQVDARGLGIDATHRAARGRGCRDL